MKKLQHQKYSERLGSITDSTAVGAWSGVIMHDSLLCYSCLYFQERSHGAVLVTHPWPLNHQLCAWPQAGLHLKRQGKAAQWLWKRWCLSRVPDLSRPSRVRDGEGVNICSCPTIKYQTLYSMPTGCNLGSQLIDCGCMSNGRRWRSLHLWRSSSWAETASCSKGGQEAARCLRCS